MSRQLMPVQLSPIGLEITPAEVRAVQLSRAGSQTGAVCRACFPRQGEPGAGTLTPEEAAWIAGVLARRGFVGARVSVTPPPGSCSAHIVDLPARDSGAPIEAIARAEIARNRRCAPDRFELAAWYLPQRGKTERGLAVACERPDLNGFLDTLEHAGLDPVGVDLEETALARACQGVLASEDDAIHALVRIGWESTLAVLSLGPTVIYTRRFELGVGPFVDRLRERAGISWNDACRMVRAGTPADADVFEQAAGAMWARLGDGLADELDTAITYVSHANRSAGVGRVLLAGYGTHRADLVGGLDDALGMSVGVAGGWASDGDAAQDARIAVAAGLAGRFDQ